MSEELDVSNYLGENSSQNLSEDFSTEETAKERINEEVEDEYGIEDASYTLDHATSAIDRALERSGRFGRAEK